ncbi:Coenzyme F420 hydrogenase/dehydrogenase, beta subunit C-terminal domain [Sinorhizobium numidicum]|uniref:Coenzyme F420 hydrogenase/dehydrogenase, beta subunit C-terminal domain n=1 Tax=Sinorhizobium numidicum TaxID=680248 RepID=A0ABY8D349_9HYPH|nr:Coenzyme F420 hydrogenase/dehydrogenase, beta subunit C-terminal domain [Sinorhizobium numidicum]WEX77483.1 Coenzyme F420 hydrogenase/dehydrogenase, beta subunit C-terminal domain [Sinorhizobium numidicum]WEX84143.1 Coenzyme F420 hydrogenase/dehydrogenase, beta subunit C-terminal domain [Sinorhizobium numidicum]
MSSIDPPSDAVPLGPKEIVKSGLCIGCGACAAQIPGNAARMRLDRYGEFKPAAPSRRAESEMPGFAHICPFSPRSHDEDELAAERFPSAKHRDPLIGRFEAAYVGYVREQDFRAVGSSGGMASWMAAELLDRKLVDGVAHVVPVAVSDDRGDLFRYQISRTTGDVRGGAKSRYHPVELSAVLAEIKAWPGRYAIVGIPCFIKAVHLLRMQDSLLRERIVFTLGLFCGHMKSARFVESFAWQMGATMEAVESADYRLKDPRRPANWYTAQLRLKDGRTRSKDWWHLADGDWGAGFFQNSACNFCDDVTAETADISFGDAWVEPYSSDGRGTNVVVVRSPLLHGVISGAIAEGRLELTEVDSEFVVRTQAAGFRQRREGLSFRLSWPRLGVQPKKRVAPRCRGLPARRMLIYWMRARISAWSHRMFWLSRLLGTPRLYIRWARAVLALYQAITYSRGWLGAMVGAGRRDEDENG